MNDDQKRQGYVEEILSSLLSNVPASYNKEVIDTNFYKLLRAATQELTDARLAIDEVKDNIYMDTATKEALYNNFGVYVRLQKRADWSEEKYRSLIKGVSSALLKGPNKENLLEAFHLFTQFDVKVFELYKDKDLIDPGVYAGYNPKYTFLLQIEKPIDAIIDTSSLAEDANYIINIIKPAHTIGIYVVNLKGEEDFRHYYGIEKKITEIAKQIKSRKIEERVNSWLSQHLTELINEYARDNNVNLDIATNDIYELNFGKSKSEYEIELSAKTESLYQEYMNSFAIQPKNLNQNDYLIPVFAGNEYRGTHFAKLAETKLIGSLDAIYLSELRESYYYQFISNMTQSQLTYIIKTRKDELIQSYIVIPENDVDDFTDEEWNNKAIYSLKDEAFTNKVIASFQTTNSNNTSVSGETLLQNESITEAKKLQGLLENAYGHYPYYTGMDKIYVESNNIHSEHDYGWKSIGHPSMFYTSLSFNKSQIGGTDLIGPIYELDDRLNQDFSVKNEEHYLNYRTIFITNHSDVSGDDVLSGIIEMDESNEFEIKLGFRIEGEPDEEKARKNEEKFNLPAGAEEIKQEIDVLYEEKYALGKNSRLQLNNRLSRLNEPEDILLLDDEKFSNKYSAEIELEEKVNFRYQMFGFILNNPNITLNYASNTMSTAKSMDDNCEGKLYRVNTTTGDETIIEERAAI